MSRKEPNRNVYVGHRYVPLILEEWDKKFEYEGLSVVTYQGGSYTSKKRVPVGIDILNKEFWSLTGNYNAQVDYYREETERVSNKLDSKSDITYVDTELGKKANKTYVDTELGKKANKTYVDTELDKKSDQTYVDNKLNEVDSKINEITLNLEEYGVVGDGITDDSDNIQNALSQIVSLYGKDNLTITLPKKLLLRHNKDVGTHDTEKYCVKFDRFNNLKVVGSPTVITRDVGGENESFQFFECNHVSLSDIHNRGTDNLGYSPNRLLDNAGGLARFRGCKFIKVYNVIGENLNSTITLHASDVENGNEQLKPCEDYNIEVTIKNTGNAVSLHGAERGTVKATGSGYHHRIFWVGNVTDTDFISNTTGGGVGSSGAIANISSNYSSNNYQKRLNFTINADNTRALGVVRFVFKSLKNYGQDTTKINRAVIEDIKIHVNANNMARAIHLDIDESSFDSGYLKPILKNIEISGNMYRDRVGLDVSGARCIQMRNPGDIVDFKNVFLRDLNVETFGAHSVDIGNLDNLVMSNVNVINHDAQYPVVLTDMTGYININNLYCYTENTTTPGIYFAGGNAVTKVSNYHSDTPRRLQVHTFNSGNVFQWSNVSDREGVYDTLAFRVSADDNGHLDVSHSNRFTLGGNETVRSMSDDMPNSVITIIPLSANSEFINGEGNILLDGGVNYTATAYKEIKFHYYNGNWRMISG